jgi:hypothetical protein
MKYVFHIVDVFSSTPFGGNQLAVLPEAAGISTEDMQNIAREFNFGETTGGKELPKLTGADGTPGYTIRTLDDWIVHVKASGHTMLEEEKFHIESYGDIAHLWSSYAPQSDAKQVARGVNSIQAIKEAGGWRVTGIMVQEEPASMPLPKECPS